MAILTSDQPSSQPENRDSITWAIAPSPSHHSHQHSVRHGLSLPWQGVERSEGDRPQRTVPRKFYLQLHDISWCQRNQNRRNGLLNHPGGWAWVW